MSRPVAGSAGRQQVWSKGRISLRSLAILAVLSIAAWQVGERVLWKSSDPGADVMRNAALAAAAAQREIFRLKEEMGLLQPPSADPNRTGLIGPDWSEIATTIGDLTAKRTATNPDLAAVIVRMLQDHGIRRGQTVGAVLSGSFVGANIATVAALEAMGLKVVIVSSIGASMYGAADPEFTWLDIETALAKAGIFKVRSVAVVAGGESAMGNSLSETGRKMLTAAAQRNGFELVAGSDFAAIKEAVKAEFSRAAPEGLAALVSAGGAVLSIGTCADASRLPSGIVRGRQPCSDGVPGFIHDLAEAGAPVLHILNMKRFALDRGLPYDPIPMPEIGNNRKIYGRRLSP